MSSVQLSSSAQDRLLARGTFPLRTRTRACRNLFGPVDHEELNREMKAKLRELSERDQQRWNFNFEANTPLDGDYVWEESPAEQLPMFYQDSIKTRDSRGASVDVLPACGDRLTVPESSTPIPAQTNQENRTNRINSGKKSKSVVCAGRKRRTTTRITDFFVKSRRTAEVKHHDSVHHHTSSLIPVEQTPRKIIR